MCVFVYLHSPLFANYSLLSFHTDVHDIRKDILTNQGEAGFVTAIGILTRTLQQTGDDTDAAIATVTLINKMVTEKDAKFLQVHGMDWSVTVL